MESFGLTEKEEFLGVTTGVAELEVADLLFLAAILFEPPGKLFLLVIDCTRLLPIFVLSYSISFSIFIFQSQNRKRPSELLSGGLSFAEGVDQG